MHLEPSVWVSLGGVGVTLIFALVSFAVIWGKVSQKVEELPKAIAALQERLDEIEEELGKKVSESTCETKGNLCRASLCGRIEESTKSSKEAASKVDGLQVFLNKELRGIAEHMGEVKQFMRIEEKRH